MKKNTNALTAAYIAFFAIMMLSGTLSGIVSEAVYYLAYALPLAAVMIFLKDQRDGNDLFSMTREGVKLFLPTVFPTVLAVILLSYLTSVLMFYVFGETSSVDVGSNLLFALFYHACLPAVLEELLFRFLPLRFIAPHSKRYAVIFSSVAFALAHHSFFSIPYALFAGVVFMTVDLLCDSLLPSVILHFVNNAVSVLWAMYFSTPEGGAIVASAIVLLSLLSVFPIIKRRGEYSRGLKEIFAKRGEPYFTLTMLCASVAAAVVAVFELAV